MRENPYKQLPPIERKPDGSLYRMTPTQRKHRILNREVRKLGYNIPPLVNAYMSLSPTMKLFGTAINYGFGDVEETGDRKSVV